MNKGYGQKIAIRFTKPLLGDVAGTNPPASYGMVLPPGIPTASGQYSATYSPDKAFDGSTSTYWHIRDTGDQWIQIELPRAQMTNGFRWYIGSSYRPNGFTVQGSNDGESWTNIYSDNSANTTGWKEFFWDPAGPFKFYRWTVTSRHSTYLYIYEIELSLGFGNEAAFTVSGSQKNPPVIGGLELTQYPVISVERYPETNDTILLTVDPLGRFNNVEGDITVSYERDKGTLTGVKPVEDFEESFTPTDLIPTPVGFTPHEITGAIGLEADFIAVTYKDLHHLPIITGAIDLEVELINVEDINP